MALALALPWVVGTLLAGKGSVAIFGLPISSASAPSWGDVIRFAVGPAARSPIAWLLVAGAVLPAGDRPGHPFGLGGAPVGAGAGIVGHRLRRVAGRPRLLRAVGDRGAGAGRLRRCGLRGHRHRRLRERPEPPGVRVAPAGQRRGSRVRGDRPAARGGRARWAAAGISPRRGWNSRWPSWPGPVRACARVLWLGRPPGPAVRWMVCRLRSGLRADARRAARRGPGVQPRRSGPGRRGRPGRPPGRRRRNRAPRTPAGPRRCALHRRGGRAGPLPGRDEPGFGQRAAAGRSHDGPRSSSTTCSRCRACWACRCTRTGADIPVTAARAAALPVHAAPYPSATDVAGWQPVLELARRRAGRRTGAGGHALRGLCAGGELRPDAWRPHGGPATGVRLGGAVCGQCQGPGHARPLAVPARPVGGARSSWPPGSLLAAALIGPRAAASVVHGAGAPRGRRHGGPRETVLL